MLPQPPLPEYAVALDEIKHLLPRDMFYFFIEKHEQLRPLWKAELEQRSKAGARDRMANHLYCTYNWVLKLVAPTAAGIVKDECKRDKTPYVSHRFIGVPCDAMMNMETKSAREMFDDLGSRAQYVDGEIKRAMLLETDFEDDVADPVLRNCRQLEPDDCAYFLAACCGVLSLPLFTPANWAATRRTFLTFLEHSSLGTVLLQARCDAMDLEEFWFECRMRVCLESGTVCGIGIPSGQVSDHCDKWTISEKKGWHIAVSAKCGGYVAFPDVLPAKFMQALRDEVKQPPQEEQKDV